MLLCSVRCVSDLGDLLELLHGAGESFRTLRSEIRVWEEPELARSAMTAAMSRRVSRVRVGSSRSGSGFLTPPTGTSAPSDPSESSVQLWVERPGRFREEQRDGDGASVVVRDGVRWWSYDDRFGARSNEGDEAPGRSRVGGELEFLADPAGLLSLLRFEVCGRGERARRDVLRARAWPRDELTLPSSQALIPLGAGASEYELEVDAARGVLLRSAAIYDSAQFRVVEVDEIAFDQDLPAGTFTFASPDGQLPASDSDRSHLPRHVAVYEAARLAPFQVFALSGLTDAWAVQAMFQSGRERPPAPPEVSLMYLTGEATSMIMVSQKAAADAAKPSWEGRAPADAVVREVERDGLTIRVLDGGPDFGATVAWVMRADTAIEITSSDLDADALIELATRLRPAPTEPPTI